MAQWLRAKFTRWLGVTSEQLRPDQSVSELLGHTSIRTTEKHYAPWVQAFQDQADQAMRQAEASFRVSAQAASASGKSANTTNASGTRPKSSL